MFAIPVRQSTAFETAIGPVLDANGVAVTDCVVGDFKLKKTTGNFAALNGSATLTHVSAGVYDLVLTTSDVDTVGLNAVAIDDTVNACPILYLQVIEEAVYDALYAAAAAGYQVPIWAAASSTVNLSATTVNLVNTVTTLTSLPSAPTDWLNSTALAASALAEIRTYLFGQDVAAQYDASGYAKISDGTGTGQVGLTGGAVDTVLAVTTLNGIAANVITATSIADGAIDAATFAGDVTTYYEAFFTAFFDLYIATGGSNLTNLGGMSTTMKGQVQTEAEEALQTYHLDHLIASADPGSIVANSSLLAKLVSKSATPAFSSYDNTTDSLEASRDNIGTAGAGLTAADDAVLAAIAALNNITAASVWAVGTRTLTGLGFTLGSGDFGTDWLTSTGLAASAVAEIQSGLATAAAVSTLQTSVDTIDDFLDTEVAAILAAVDTEVGSILALLDDPRTEPGQGAPPVNPDMATKVDYLYKAWRNKKTQTSTTLSLFADDTTTVDQKSTVSDDGTTLTVGEMATGP